VNRGTGKVDTYKMYADWPIEQFTAGTFIARFPPEVNGFDYWKTHGWTLIRVLGIPAKR
jgi:hypothetical protein